MTATSLLRVRAAALLLSLLSVLSVHAQDPALAPRPGESPEPEAAQVEVEHERGTASWYGRHFHGRRTASGELFDMRALTAAHPSLPFGTIVRVRNLRDGRSVDVRINDRGPHIGKRIIDLSRAAAEVLGLVHGGRGTRQVAITLLSAVERIRPRPARPAGRRSR